MQIGEADVHSEAIQGNKENRIASSQEFFAMTASSLPFPRWIYIPGEISTADHETLAIAKILVPARFHGHVPARHTALVYGIALNDNGFFWECHEILEAVWAAAPQGGRERILLRACIQTANANLKLLMNRALAAQRLWREALAELDELAVRQASGLSHGFADAFPAAALAERLRAACGKPVTALCQPVWLATRPPT